MRAAVSAAANAAAAAQRGHGRGQWHALTATGSPSRTALHTSHDPPSPSHCMPSSSAQATWRVARGGLAGGSCCTSCCSAALSPDSEREGRKRSRLPTLARGAGRGYERSTRVVPERVSGRAIRHVVRFVLRSTHPPLLVPYGTSQLVKLCTFM